MKATFHDIRKALTPRNCVALAASALVSVISIEIFGYLVWRRFVVPSVIVLAAALARQIAQAINHDGLKHVVNAASVGMFGFAVAIFVGAMIDGLAFPNIGYFTFSAVTVLWLWVSFHLHRALRILRRMPVERKQMVTDGTEAIYAQMTYREHRIEAVLEDAKRKAAKVGVKLQFN